jgi:cytochrome bd-type quinol oxidase subunit 2
VLEFFVPRAAPVRGWLATRHRLRVEVALVLGLYAVYEAARGVGGGDRGVAMRHARDIVSLERTLHAFHEAEVQHAAQRVGGLVSTLGIAYLTLHLALTATLLLWLHQRRPASYPLVRTTLVVASAIATIAYSAYPTAPPRLSGLGILDTISGRLPVNLDRGLVSSLYNPYAAMPSMHAGYALVLGVTVARHARRRWTRAAALLYPAFVVLVIVTTGNHFFADAVGGFVAVAAAAAVSALVLRGSPTLRSCRSASPRAPVRPHATPA